VFMTLSVLFNIYQRKTQHHANFITHENNQPNFVAAALMLLCF